jgi:hypothetical protein
MFARIGAKALFLTAAAALIFFGIGLLGMALAIALAAFLGPAGAYALAGGILVTLALAIIGLMALLKPRRRAPPPGAFLPILMAALAKDLPWAAVISAGLAAASEMWLKRQRNKAKE